MKNIKEILELFFHFKFRALLIEPTQNSFLQFCRYVLVGGIAALVDWSILYLITQSGLYYMFSAIISFLAGLFVNFILSKKLVFKAMNNKTGIVIEFLIYALIGIIGLGITLVLMYFFTEKLEFFYMLSKIIATVIVLVWNFLARKFMLYKNK